MTEAPALPGYSRSLSFFEAFTTMSSTTIWYTMHVEGPVDLEKLREAWGLLSQAHPVLTGRLAPGSAEFLPGWPSLDLVVPAAPPEPEVRVREAVGAHEKLTYSAAQDRELAFVDLVPGDGQTLVSFAVHHAIADGNLGYYWNRELWSYYTDLVEGKAPDVEPHPVPKSPEALLAEHGSEKADLPVARIEKATPTELPQSEGVNFTRDRVRLSGVTTAKLRAMARAHNQSVHGLVAGAVAVATRRKLPVAAQGEVDLAIMSLVDVRERLEPPVPIWGGTNVLGHATAVVAVSPGSDPVAIGAQVLAQLAEDLEAGVVHQGFLHFADDFGKPQPKVPLIITTNIGALEPIRTPAGLSATDFRSWVEADWAPITATMQAAGQPGGATRGATRSAMYIISTYGGRLSVEIGLPASSQAVRDHAQTLEAILVALAGRS